jgi:hypothetical protein
MADCLMGEALQRLRILVDLTVRLVVLAGVVKHQRKVGYGVLQRLVAIVAQLQSSSTYRPYRLYSTGTGTYCIQ